MSPSRNYYLILGVRRSATTEQIEKAHREKLKFYHPDRWRDNESMYRQAEAESKAINEAYYHLSDPVRRAKYDQKPPETDTGYRREDVRRNQAQDAQRRAEQAASEEAARRKAEQGRQRQTSEAAEEEAGYKYKQEQEWREAAAEKQRHAQAEQQRRQDKNGSVQKYARWILGAVVLSLVVGALSISGIWSTSESTVQPTVTVTQSIAPTFTPLVFPTDVSPYSADCIPWPEVTYGHLRSRICVYGRVTRISSIDQTSSIINFSELQNTFFLLTAGPPRNVSPYNSRYAVPLSEELCIFVWGRVELNDNSVPYISVTETLYLCEPWMK